LDSYLEREHIPPSAGKRAKSERSIAVSQVSDPEILYQIAPESDMPPVIDFAADADIVRTIVEGERLTYGYLFNPAFATEISLIDPLPHQRIAVYDHMLKQTRLRWMKDFEAIKIEFKPDVRQRLLWRNAQHLLAHTAVGHMHFS